MISQGQILNGHIFKSTGPIANKQKQEELFGDTF